MKKKIMKCRSCNHPEQILSEAPDGRPQFTCTKCKSFWTCGKNGGEWMLSKFLKVPNE